MNRLTGRSWQHLLLVLTLAVSLSVAGAVAAQDEDAGAPEPAEEASADAAEDLGADEMVRKKIDDWKANDLIGISFQERSEKGEISLVAGVATALYGIQEKSWGKSRAFAYTKAFSEAMKKYVSRIRERVTTELLRNYFADFGDSELVYQPGESTDDMVLRVATKALTLGERNLDQALLETGMSQDEIERLTPPQKKTAFSDRMVRRVTTVSFGSADGLVPVKTFEALDDEGNSAIGVVAVASNTTKTVAKQIAARKVIRPDGNRVRSSIADQIGALSDNDLVNEFGPRIWWDENGYPTIVAFGQWAWSPEGLDKRKKARRRDFALKQASSDAKFHLATFVNASTRFTEVADQSEEAEEFSLVDRDNVVSDADTEEFIDTVVEEARVKADVNLTGLKALRQWFNPHPQVEGHELVGVVVSWSPAQEDRVGAELGKKPKHQPPRRRRCRRRASRAGPPRAATSWTRRISERAGRSRREKVMSGFARRYLSPRLVTVGSAAALVLSFLVLTGANAQSERLEREIAGSGADDMAAILSALQEATFQICGVRISSTLDVKSTQIETTTACG